MSDMVKSLKISEELLEGSHGKKKRKTIKTSKKKICRRK